MKIRSGNRGKRDPNMNEIWVGVMILVVVIAIVCFRQYQRESALKSSRKNADVHSFISHFQSRGIPETLSRNVYHNLPSIQMIVRDFPVIPTDNLATIYRVGGVSGTPLEEFIDELAPLCGLPIPSFQQVMQLIQEESPITTVEDLVRVLARLDPGKEGENSVSSFFP